MDKVRDILLKGIAEGLYSGAQLVVSEVDQTTLSLAVGTTRLRNTPNDLSCSASSVTPHTLFDLASLTKPIATSTLMMLAYDDGIYSPEQKLIAINGMQFPAVVLGKKVGDLLSHQTPLPAVFDLHGAVPRCEDHFSATHYAQLDTLSITPRKDGETWCYSDVGYILLGMMIENAYGASLDKVFSTRITSKLGLQTSLLYNPLHWIPRATIAATSLYCGAYLQGHPDDANARALTHMAGHAGLFGSAEAVAAFVRAMLSGHFPIRRSTVVKFLTYRSPNTPFCLGWDRPTSDDSLSARKQTDNVIGHLGFTGCSVWIDMNTLRSVTLLTNRVHLQDNPKAINDLRREVYRLCWAM